MRLVKLIFAVVLTAVIIFIWRNLPDRNSVSLPQISVDGLLPLVQQKIENTMESVRAEPQSAQAWGELGMVLIAHDYPEAARTCLTKASKLDPDEFRWPYYSASTYSEYDFEGAERLYDQAHRLKPSYLPLNIHLAHILIRLGKFEKAAKVLTEAKRFSQDNPYLLVTLGRLKLLQGERSDAREFFERATQQPDWMPLSAYQELLKLAQSENDFEKVAEYQGVLAGLPHVARLEVPDPVFEEIRRLEALAKSNAEQADQALARGDPSTAILIYESLIEQREDLPTLTTNLANAYGMIGRYQDAIQYYEKTLLNFKNYIPAMMGLAATRNLRGETNEALANYREVIKIKPNHQRAWFLMGTIHEQSGDLEAAFKCYQKSATVDPSFPQAQLATGMILMKQNQYHEALGYVQRAVDLAPSDPTPAHFLDELQQKMEPTE